MRVFQVSDSLLGINSLFYSIRRIFANLELSLYTSFIYSTRNSIAT